MKFMYEGLRFLELVEELTGLSKNPYDRGGAHDGLLSIVHKG